MRKNLLIGILGGAAVGAAAGYLLATRGNLGKDLRNLADSAIDKLSEEGEEHVGMRQRKGHTTSRRG